jgi:hypothetical protein
MSNYHYGDNITQYGKRSIGKVSYQAPADLRLALLEIIRLAEELRGQVSVADCQVIDESVEILGGGDTVDHGSLRRALSSIAGIATIVGEVGVPVIEAVRKVITALGVG